MSEQAQSYYVPVNALRKSSPHSFLMEDYTVVVKRTDYIAETARADRADAKYTDLAQIVEGLPKWDGEIKVSDYYQGHVFLQFWKDRCIHISIQFNQDQKQLADALARLLAWRQGGQSLSINKRSERPTHD